VKLGDVDISNMLGIGGQAMGNKFDPVTGLPANWFEGRPDMPWYEKVYNNAIWNRNAALNKQMKSLPDVSIMEPGKLVTGRGTELPMTYQLSSDKVGGVEGIYAEYARFKKWLGEQGIDTSKLKYDVITQYGAEGSITHQGSLFGPLRIPDSIRKGRQMSDITKSIAENAGEGYRSFNEQAARYEDTMDKMPLWTERFGSLGKSIANTSWQFTTLQMAALGIFFSMMSIVSVMSQGIGLVIGGIGDLDAMMKAKAMAGMSGNFKDESGNVFTGAYIDEALGITDQTRIDAWKNLTDLSSTISTMLSGFGSKVLTDPRFLESANDFVGRLFNVVTNPDNLEIVVNLSQTLFETIGNIVDKLPSLIKLFDMIASFHVPEGVPLIGGQSAFSIYGQAALLSLIAMPIMAGFTLLTKMSGWVLESVGILGKINQWNVGRQIEQFALKEGYSKEAAALFRATGGMPKVSPEDAAFYKRAGVDLSKLPTTGLGDDVLKSGSKSASVIDDIAERLAPIAAKLPKRATVATAAAVAGASVVTKGIEAANAGTPDVLDKTSTETPISEPDITGKVPTGKVPTIWDRIKEHGKKPGAEVTTKVNPIPSPSTSVAPNSLLDTIGKDHWEWRDGKIVDITGRTGHPTAGFLAEELFGVNNFNYAGFAEVSNQEIGDAMESIFKKLDINGGYLTSDMITLYDNVVERFTSEYNAGKNIGTMPYDEILKTQSRLHEMWQKSGGIDNIKPPSPVDIDNTIKTSSIVESGTSKWKWAGKTIGANAIGMLPVAVEIAVPETAPVMGPTNMGSLPYGVARMAGMGSTGAAAIAAPVGVVLNAEPVGGGDISYINDRAIEKIREPFMGILDLPGLTKNAYYDVESGQKVEGFTDYDWEMSKKQANGMAEDPLNSKWTKDSGATFNQTNTFNTTVPVDEIGQILDYVRGIARQVGV
jgi:hypothetical protein